MIKINLCPIDELESQYKYVPDVVALIVAAVATYAGAQYYIGTIEEEIAQVQAEAQAKKEAHERLKPDLEQFKNLQKDIVELKGKIQALQNITVSKISRYKPVIVAEHLQNLKPEGVWFHSFKIGTKADPNYFEIKGQAFDNILVAELMTALRSTEAQEKDEADLRTQIFFNGITLNETGIKQGGGDGFAELAIYPEFSLKGAFREREGGGAGGGGGGGITYDGALPPKVTLRVEDGDGAAVKRF